MVVVVVTEGGTLTVWLLLEDDLVMDEPDELKRRISRGLALTVVEKGFAGDNNVGWRCGLGGEESDSR